MTGSDSTVDCVDNINLTGNDCDERFARLPEGIELALHRAKILSKYTKDIANYIEKRINIEVENARNIMKLAQSTKPSLKEESLLPLQSLYLMTLDCDLDYAHSVITTSTNIYTLLESLSSIRNDIEKTRKTIKAEWIRECKRTSDALNALRRLKNTTREQECKAALDEVNERTQSCEESKKVLLLKIREMIYSCDARLKDITLNYLSYLQNLTSPLSIQYSTLCENVKYYSPGGEYITFVEKLPLDTFNHPSIQEDMANYQPDHYDLNSDKNDILETCSNHNYIDLTNPSECFECGAYVCFRGVQCIECGHIAHNKCLSTCSTLCYPPHMIPSIVIDCIQQIDKRGLHTKGLYRLSGVKSKVDMCIEALGLKNHSRSNSAFVSPSLERSTTTGCISQNEMEKTVLERSETTAIYSASGSIEKDEKSVLDRVGVSVIASLLKWYLRNLPEPLCCYKYYDEWIKVAMKFNKQNIDTSEIYSSLRLIVEKLPKCEASTLSLLCHHLSRVAAQSEFNNMPSSNLGIVFGPTLCRPDEGASHSLLVNAIYQTKIAQWLIDGAQEVFGYQPKVWDEEVKLHERKTSVDIVERSNDSVKRILGHDKLERRGSEGTEVRRRELSETRGRVDKFILLKNKSDEIDSTTRQKNKEISRGRVNYDSRVPAVRSVSLVRNYIPRSFSLKRDDSDQNKSEELEKDSSKRDNQQESDELSRQDECKLIRGGRVVDFSLVSHPIYSCQGVNMDSSRSSLKELRRQFFTSSPEVSARSIVGSSVNPSTGVSPLSSVTNSTLVVSKMKRNNHVMSGAKDEREPKFV